MMAALLVCAVFCATRVGCEVENHRMKSKDLARLIRVHERLAQSVCAPIIFPDTEGQFHNGSMTFIRSDSEVLGVTNAHVADKIRHCKDELGKRCQVGAAYFDPGRLIA